MASYTQELDNALLQVPWLAKVDANSKPFMLKYAPHPSKPGYITLLTDLTKVYFEPLAGIRVLARQREVEEKFGQSQPQRDGGSSLDLGGEEAVAEVLDELAGLMGEIDNAELEIKAGDLYDLDVTVKSARGNWLYHMTEIRYGCLEVITRHVIHPLALSIASSRRPASSTDNQIVELVSSSTVLGAINRHSSHSKKPAGVTATSKSPKMTTVKSPSPAEFSEEKDHEGADSKTRLVRRRPGGIMDSTDAGPSSPRRTFRTKSPSPVKTNNTKKLGSRPTTDNDPEDESMPPEDDEEEHRSPTPAPAPSLPRSRKKKADSPPEQDDDMEAGEDGTPAPPVPPPSQKTQLEKDEEEEEELAKKREEMKRKMGAGGGGRLVRRRFG